MSYKWLKIENLENLQELNAEEFSSIQGGFTEQSYTSEKSLIDFGVDEKAVTEHFETQYDPCYTPPCESYIFNDDGEIVGEFTCNVNVL